MLTELSIPRSEEVLPTSVVDELTSAALEYIDARYDNPPDPRQKLSYHGSLHTLRVIDRVGRILRALQAADPTLVSERDIQLGTIAAAFHDTVQQWGATEVEIADMPALMMKRKTGLNEKASAFMARAHMLALNGHNGAEIFTEKDMQDVTEAILGTIPGFDMRLRTVIQPHVSEESSIITKALALADLGGPAMDGPATYLWEGNNLFHELNVDLRYAQERGVPVAQVYEESVKKRALEWTAGQAEFAHGRAVRFHQTELLWLPEHVRGAVEVEFGFYNESILAAQAAYERRLPMSCGAILQDMMESE